MIPAENSNVAVYAQSHEGRTGKNNEDRYGVTTFQVSPSDATPALLAVVSDGIGGHLAGEVAAEIAVKTIAEEVTESDARQPVETITAAIIEAGERVRRQAESQQGQQGMGATCACAWIIGERLYIASVGDSRIYLIRDQAIRQLTTDHTWVQEAIEHGALTPEQARNHPNVHVIRRYLGSKTPVVPDTRLRLAPGESDNQAERNQGMQLKPSDRLVLCSDGLTDLVADHEILAALQTNYLESGVQYLINLANHRGGLDNITVIGLEYSPAQESPQRAGGVRRLAYLTCVGFLLLFLVALSTFLLLGWYFS